MINLIMLALFVSLFSCKTTKDKTEVKTTVHEKNADFNPFTFRERFTVSSTNKMNSKLTDLSLKPNEEVLKVRFEKSGSNGMYEIGARFITFEDFRNYLVKNGPFNDNFVDRFIAAIKDNKKSEEFSGNDDRLSDLVEKVYKEESLGQFLKYKYKLSDHIGLGNLPF